MSVSVILQLRLSLFSLARCFLFCSLCFSIATATVFSLGLMSSAKTFFAAGDSIEFIARILCFQVGSLLTPFFLSGFVFRFREGGLPATFRPVLANAVFVQVDQYRLSFGCFRPSDDFTEVVFQAGSKGELESVFCHLSFQLDSQLETFAHKVFVIQRGHPPWVVGSATEGPR